MANVPYSPVPQVSPTDQPVPYRSEGVPAGAFGENIGRAVEHLGQTMSHVGDEVWARAVAMQQLNQQADANAALADYQIKLGQMHADYSATSGKTAVDGLQPYMQSTESLRQDIGSKLDSDYARKVFDAESRSTRGRTIFNAAGHAATENKRYVTGASQSRIDAAGNSALIAPADEEQFQAGLKTVQDEIDQQGILQGWSPEQKAEKLAQSTSNLWVARIQGLAKEQPFTAQKLLDKAVKEGQLQGGDIGKITDFVNKQMYTTGSRQISNEVLSGNSLKFGAQPVDIKQAQAAIGGYESTNNYAALGVEVFRKDGTSRGRALGKYQVMPENLQPWLKQAGIGPMTEAEFLKSPSAQDQVFNTIFGGYMKQYGTFNDAASMWFSGKPQATAGDVKDANKTTVPGYLKATNAILAKGAQLNDLVAAGKSRATELSPNDPMLGDYVQQRIIQEHNQTNAMRRDAEFNNRTTVEQALLTGDKDGKLPTTVEDLKAIDPKVEAAYNASSTTNQIRFNGLLAKIAKGDTAMTPERLQEYVRLRGMAENDPAGFLDEDILSKDLPIKELKELSNLQIKKKSNSEADPQLTRALNWLKPDLQPAGIINDKANKDTYNQFVGSLADAVRDFQTENKRGPKYEEVRVIGARLLQQIHSDQFWFRSSTDNMFKIPVPDEAAKIIRNDPTWKAQGIDLEAMEDDQRKRFIQRVYTAAQYQQLYGKKVPSTTAPK